MQPDSTPFKPLMSLHQVQVAIKDGTRIGPIDWVLSRRERVQTLCATPAQWMLLNDLLCGIHPPVSGSLQEGSPLVINSDRIIWERMDINRGINDLLETGTLPPHIWLDSGKINLWVLLDRLGLEPHLRRIPLRHAPALIRERYWVFRFLVSESDLMMGGEIFAVSDPVSRDLLAQRWNHWPGTLLAGCIREHLPGPVQQLARIDDQGLFTLSPLPVPA